MRNIISKLINMSKSNEESYVDLESSKKITEQNISLWINNIITFKQ